MAYTGMSEKDINSISLTTWVATSSPMMPIHRSQISHFSRSFSYSLSIPISAYPSWPLFCFRSISSAYITVAPFFRKRYLPKGQTGYLQTSQFRHSPPWPSSASSRLPIFSPASTLGRTRSKIVVFAYIPQAGMPKMGISPR